MPSVAVSSFSLWTSCPFLTLAYWGLLLLLCSKPVFVSPPPETAPVSLRLTGRLLSFLGPVQRVFVYLLLFFFMGTFCLGMSQASL